MPNENEFQLRIIKSAERLGGYGKKWSSEFQVGVPDLVLVLPWRGVVFMEVKLLATTRPDFDRKLNVTKKQGEELRRLSVAGANVVVGVVVTIGPRDTWLYVCPGNTLRLTGNCQHPKVQWKANLKFDLSTVL